MLMCQLYCTQSLVRVLVVHTIKSRPTNQKFFDEIILKKSMSREQFSLTRVYRLQENILLKLGQSNVTRERKQLNGQSTKTVPTRLWKIFLSIEIRNIFR